MPQRASILGVCRWNIMMPADCLKKDPSLDARSKLPDGTEVADLRAIQAYLVNDRIDQVAFSVLKHFTCYATGRSLTYNELVRLRKESGRSAFPGVSHAGFGQVRREQRFVPEEVSIEASRRQPRHLIGVRSMPGPTQLDRRSVLKGLARVTLTLPILEAMGEEVASEPPRGFVPSTPPTACRCRIRSTRCPSGIGFQPTEGKRLRIRQVDRAARPFRNDISFLGGLQHPNGAKADPHICSDMWLTGAPLHDPKPGTFNSVSLDQVIALHTKKYCRQPSLVLSIDAGIGFLSRTATISYNLDGQADPGRKQPATRLRSSVPRRSIIAQGAARPIEPTNQAGRRGARKFQVAAQEARQVRQRANGPVLDFARRSRRAVDRLRKVDRRAPQAAGLLPN